tara:strand:+ start:144 stop:3200 length:3057 start_codon:yes stop_codon:yes gene_type:complete
MARYYSYVDSTVGLGNTTVQNMLSNGSEYGVVPSVDIVARNITATGNFIGTLTSSDNVFADLKVTGIATIGIVTGATYYGDGSNLSGVGTFSGDYNDLSNKPTIPTNNNELTNGAGYITNSVTGDFDVSGNFGLGTTNPQTINHIFGQDPILRIQDSSTPIADAFAAIQLAETVSGGGLGNYWQIALEGDSGTSSDSLTFKDGTAERMRLDSSGRLLLGTTTEGYAAYADNLTIADSGDCGVTIRSGTSNQGNIYFSDGLSGGSEEYEGIIQYLHNVDAMAFGVNNGQERMRILSSGNVGINDNNPTTKLDVNGDIGIREGNNLTWHDTNGTPSFRIRSGSDNILHFERASNSATQMIIDDGKLGIGTEPSDKLHISGSNTGGFRLTNEDNSDAISVFMRGGNPIANTTDDAILSLGQRSSVSLITTGRVGVGTATPDTTLRVTKSTVSEAAQTNDIAVFERNDNGYIKLYSANNKVGGLAFGDPDDAFIGAIRYNHDGDYMDFYVNNSERMRIVSTGQVLIGTTAASRSTVTTRLSAYASDNQWMCMDVGATQSGNTGGIYGVRSRSSSHNPIALASAYESSTAVTCYFGGGWGSFGRSANELRFYTSAGLDNAAGTTGNTRMVIDSSGNLGIGNASPGYKLSVLTTGTADRVLNLATTGGAGTNGDATNSIYFTGGTNTRWANAKYEAFNHIFHGNGVERMRIDSSGRLLVGTSSAFLAGTEKKLQILTANEGSEIILGRDDSSVVAGNELGAIKFVGNAGSYQVGAEILAHADGTHGDDDKPSRLVFTTTADNASSPTERMRIDRHGFAKFKSGASSYFNSAGGMHEFVTDSNNWTILCENEGNSVPYGILIRYSATTPNNTSSQFFIGSDNTGDKVQLRSNGGIANYQSNDANLCDEREKKNIVSLDAKWDKVKSWELKKFHYNEDDDTDDLRYGVIAQQIEEHCPEVLTDWVKQRAEEAVLDNDGNVVTPAKEEILRKGVKEQQMMWMSIKALQEAMERIESLEAKVAALESE